MKNGWLELKTPHPARKFGGMFYKCCSIPNAYVHYYIYFLWLSVFGTQVRMALDMAMVLTHELVNSNSIACSSQAFIQ